MKGVMTTRIKAARKQAAQRMTRCIEIEEIVMGSERVEASGYPGSDHALVGSMKVPSLLCLQSPGFFCPPLRHG